MVFLAPCSAETVEFREGNARLSHGQIEENHLVGKVVEGRYFSGEDYFSIAVPLAIQSNGYIEDNLVTENIAGVAFFNNFGYLQRVETDETPAEVTFLISHHPEIKEEILDALFFDVLLPQLKESVPNLKVLHHIKIVLDNQEPALFAVLDLPQASTIVNSQTGVPLDSKRGYVITFSQNKYLVNFSMQDTLTLLPTAAEAAKLRLNERLLTHMLESQRTYRIEKK
jgi:hypothetical protein